MRTAMVRDASLVRNTALDHAADGKDGPTLWAAGLASWGHDDGTPYGGGAAKTRRDTRGGLIGVGYSFGDIRVGLAGGYSRTKLTIDERASNARLKTVHVLGYATGQFGGLRLRATAGYSNVNGRSDRRVAIGSFSDRLRADADGNVLQGSAEAAMPFAVAAGEIAPFVGMEGYRTKSDAFAESGGAAALRAGKRVQSSAFSRSGLQVRTPLIGSISATASVAWVHRLAGEDPTTVVSFGGTDGFRTSGAPLSRNAADAALGIGWAASERFSLSASYRGTLGDKGDDSSVRAAATFRL
jgi:outer membrane autotransporter protein